MGIENRERPGLAERNKLPLSDFKVTAKVYAEPKHDETYGSDHDRFRTAAADVASLRCNHV